MPVKDLADRLADVREADPDHHGRRPAAGQGQGPGRRRPPRLGGHVRLLPAEGGGRGPAAGREVPGPPVDRTGVSPSSAAGAWPGPTSMLRQVLAKADKPTVKAAAALGLGRALVAKIDQLGDQPAEADKVAAEGEKYLTMAVELYGKDKRPSGKTPSRN